jgi:hypothetical protein
MIGVTIIGLMLTPAFYVIWRRLAGLLSGRNRETDASLAHVKLEGPKPSA